MCDHDTAAEEKKKKPSLIVIISSFFLCSWQTQVSVLYEEAKAASGVYCWI